MPQLPADIPYTVDTVVGYAATIRENLERIETVLPLIPLPLGFATRAPGSTVALDRSATRSQTTHNRSATEVPAPKGLLAPGGRVPIAKPKSPRGAAK